MSSDIHCAHISNVNWKNGDDCPFVIGGEIDVWQISISANLHSINKFNDLLTADEHSRAGRYHQQKDRERFIISRGVLRVLLSRYLNVPAVEIVFDIGSNKKPFVKTINGIGLHYNTSHSGNYILIAVAGSTVGADVEKTDPLFPYTDVLDHSFSPHEVEYIQRSSISVEAFYTLWTRKEALLKATAKGIDDDMKLVPAINGAHIADEAIIAPGKWYVNSFAIGENYTGSIAGNCGHINFWHF